MLSKTKTRVLILFILISAFMWAILPTQQPQHSMRRESIIQPTSLDEALSISLAIGDYRKVDFSKVL